MLLLCKNLFFTNHVSYDCDYAPISIVFKMHNVLLEVNYFCLMKPYKEEERKKERKTDRQNKTHIVKNFDFNFMYNQC